MRFLSHNSLRGFIFLLLAVFIANTVYASGMMAAGQLHTLADNEIVQRHVASASTAEVHCHQQFASDATWQHQQYQQHHQQHHQHNHKHSCNDCNHCFACFTMAIQSTLSHIFSPDQLISSIQFAEIYRSPTSAQPQKPPIA